LLLSKKKRGIQALKAKAAHDLLGFFEPFIPGGRLGWGRGDIAV